MPLVDMPIDQLRSYEGRNPKPADFDAYWDDSLAEMRGIDARVELTPAEFQVPMAECFELRFTGVGGSRVFAKFIRPKHVDGPTPALLQFHGYTASSGDWNGYLNWVAAGYAVAALDCRGQGGRSQDTVSREGHTHSGHIIRGLDDPDPKNLYYRAVYLDTAQLAGIVMGMPEIDATKVVATGGSQGGGLTLACAALEPRVAKAAPWYPFLSDYQRVWEMDLDVAAYDELRKYFRFFDPLHKRESEVFNKLGYIDIQHLMPRVRAEVLMSIGLMDTITPPSTCFAAYNKIPSKKDVAIYPDFGHEGLPGFGDRVFRFLTDL